MMESVISVTWNEILKVQPTAAKILINGLKSDRLAHAYLLAGQRGVGKRELAIQLARTFFCQERDGFEPCGHCADCKRIDSGNHPDLTLIQPQ